jgi:predicted nucleic acid-binding protein
VGILIDTSVFIEYERNRLDLATRIGGRESDEFFISVITASELLHGVHRAVEPSVKARRSAWVEAILARFALLPVDLADSRVHSQLWAELGARGRLIGPHDLWLAAQCISRGLTLVTGNVREFRRVSGLELESWAN